MDRESQILSQTERRRDRCTYIGKEAERDKTDRETHKQSSRGTERQTKR